MRSFRKKQDALDQLVTHAPGAARQKAGAPVAAPERELSDSGRERLAELRSRLMRTHERGDVEILLEQIQSEFGNQIAERLVKELRLDEEETKHT